ncbi:MAG: hypothetical protein WD229_13075, partial [Pirellulales bacterium]
MIARLPAPSRAGVDFARRWALWLRALVVSGLWLTMIGFGDSRPVRAADPAETATLYRRIYVPADNIEAWPRDGEKYLPIEARDFETWLAAANAAASDAPLPAMIREATYSARLEGDRLVDCRGQWTIALRGDSPAFLPLGDMSLVVRDARWQGEPQSVARVGAWGQNGGPATGLGLEVTQAGTLEFSWKAPSRAIHNGIEVAWRLPPASAARLILDLPNGKVPTIEGGVVLESQSLPSDKRAASGNRRRWELALDPSSAATLRIVDMDGPPAEANPAVTLREDVRYHVTPRGLDIDTIWRLDGPIHEHRELELPLPKGVHLISAFIGNGKLAWRIAETDGSDAQVALIELPEASVGRPLEITLRAWHPLSLNQPWQLPWVRPMAAYWESGRVELSVDAELEMRALSHKDCVQTGVSQADDPTTGPETTRLAMYAPTADVSVTIARREPQATIRLGSSLALTDPDINGRLQAQWRVSHGSLHKLSGELAPGWIVEAVETVPADALGEWLIEGPGEHRRIEIQLARAARPDREVAVIVTGRLHRVSVGESISAETLRMVNWADGRVTRHLLTFQTLEPFAVETTGDLPAVASNAVTDEDRTLVTLATGKEMMFDLTSGGPGADLKLILERGQYEADIRIDAAYVQQDIVQNYHLTISPATNAVDRLLIYSTSPLGDKLQWTMTPSTVPLASERLPADDPRRAGLPPAGELWLVRLPGPTTQNIEITAQTVSTWPARKQLPLMAMPEAVKQQGRVLVHAAMDRVPVVEPQGMQATALPAATAETSKTDGLPPVRAAYRYDPTSCLSSGQAAQLWLEPSMAADANLLVARQVELESFFWSNGRATHCATYDLENEGAASFDLQLPADAVIRAVLLNGRALEQPVSVRSSQLSSIQLGAAARSVNVAVYFDTQQAPLKAGSELQPPLVHSEIPILGGQWTIWLPEDFSTVGMRGSAEGGSFNWRERLFGPLGRPVSQAPFHPLRPSDWARLLSPLGSAAIGASEAGSALLGWSSYRTNFLAERPSAVTVAHPPAMTAWAIGLFLICLVSGRRLRQQSGIAFVMLLALAAGCAILLPDAFAPVATGTVLGLLFSLLGAGPRRENSENVPGHSWSRFSTVSVPSVLLTLVVAKLALAQPIGQAASLPEQTQAATIERVLIPVDSDGHQGGSKWYVSEPFLRELLKRSTEETRSGGQWLLRDAMYAGELRERMDSAGIITGEWTLGFDIEVLARDTTIVLPLVRDEATWRDTAMLDGVPVPIAWRDGGRHCAIEISEPGRYWLSIYNTPRSSAENRRNLVKLTIPPLAGARLQLAYPKSLSGLMISGAEVALPSTETAGTLEFELDGSGQLEIQSPSGSWAAGGAQALRVTGLRWLRISGEQVMLQTKYVVEGSARGPEALTVAFDRRWELVQDDNSPAALRVEDEPDGRRSFQVRLAPDDADRREVTLPWRLTGARTLGRLRLPPIELVSVPVTHRWLAISTGTSLECEILEGFASAGTVNEFLAMWGDADDRPELVLGNFRTGVPWSVAVRPKQRESVIDEVLNVAAGRGILRIAYQADVVPGAEHEYQFQLITPKDLSIEEIAVREGSRQIPVRWSRVGDSQVNVFFSERVAKEYRLEVRGSAPAEMDRPRTVPRLTAEATQSPSLTVQVYRDEGVLVEMGGLTDADRLPEDPHGLPPDWTGRPVGVYRL